METRISIFGDSITWGSWDPEKGGWVARLRHYLETTTNNGDIDVYNLGVSGDTTTDLLIRFKTECLARSRRPQTIIFAIGTNDSQYMNDIGQMRTTIAQFENNLIALINQAKQFSDKIIFIGLTKVDENKTKPMSWMPEKCYTNDNIKTYNAVIENISRDNHLKFIDLMDVLDMDDLYDGLHPNANGHEKIFLKVKEAVLTAHG